MQREMLAREDFAPPDTRDAREDSPTMSNRAEAAPGFVMAVKSRHSIDAATLQFCFRKQSLDVKGAQLREFAR